MLPRLNIGKSVANQIRGSLGVNAGGASGRPKPVHKGVGLNPASGGFNTRGSGKAPSVPRPVMRQPMPNRVKPGVKPVAKLVGKPAGQAQLIKPVGPRTPAPVVAPTPPPVLGALDYRNQSEYISGMAGINRGYGDARADIASTLASNTREYTKQTADAKDGYTRSVETGEDAANHGGLLRSGAREVDNSDRFKQFDGLLAGIEEQYGATASAKLNAALEKLSQQEGEDRQSVEAGARDNYAQLYPANPIVEPIAPVAAAAGSDQRFYQSDPTRPGKYKIISKPRAGLTAAQLKAALASPLNK